MISLHPRFARRTRHSLGCGALCCPVLLPPIRSSAYAPGSQPTTAEITQRGMQGESVPLPVGDRKAPDTKTASGGQGDNLPAPSVRAQDAAQSRLRRVALPCAAPPIRSSAYAPDGQPTAAEITQRGMQGESVPLPVGDRKAPDTKTASGGQQGLSVFPGILHLPQEQFRHRLIPVKRTVSGVKSRENETRCA
jgi:hypothetical protein